MAKKLMSVTEYCKHRDLSRTQFYSHKRAGKLKGCFQQKPDSKRVYVDRAKADRALDRNVAPLQQIGGMATKRKFKKSNPSEKEIKEAVSMAGIGPNVDIAEAQRLKIVYEAALKKLEFDEKSGSLIELAKAKKIAAYVSQTFKENCLAIADRCSALCAAESDVFQCGQILKREINFILENVSRNIKLFNGENSK